jgi:hypothetical protein
MVGQVFMDQDFIVGGFYAFQIQPDKNGSHINAGKFGVFEFIQDSHEDTVSGVIVVLDGMSDTLPTLRQVKRYTPLPRPHHQQFNAQEINNEKASISNREPNVFAVFRESIFELQTHFLGSRLIPSFSRRRLAKQNHYYAPLSTAALNLNYEMRWRFDRENFLADRTKTLEREAIRQGKIAQRMRDRLRGLTIDKLLTETHLTAWDTRTDFIPPNFLKAVRAELLTLLKNLHFTDKKQPKAQVRKNLKAFLEWINVQDEQYDYPIETMEREELHELLEEVCHAAKHKSLVDEIENWRDW